MSSAKNDKKNKVPLRKSQSSHAVLDAQSRRRKAHKIMTLVSPHVGMEQAELLDIGTGSGHIAEEFSKRAKSVTSVDVTDERQVKDGYRFVKVGSAKLPFEDGSFDVAVSNHVVEHVPEQAVHLQELMRVLRPGGVLYLATPNKLWLRDPHYRLPFISWLPRSASQRYLQALRPGKVWDVYPVSHAMVRRHMEQYEVHNALPDLVKRQSETLDVARGPARLLRHVPRRLLETSKYWSPTLIYVIKKR